LYIDVANASFFCDALRDVTEVTMFKLKEKFFRQSSESSIINFRGSEEEKKAMQDKANLFTQGNLSAWLRYASTQLAPKQTDLKIVSKK